LVRKSAKVLVMLSPVLPEPAWRAGRVVKGRRGVVKRWWRHVRQTKGVNAVPDVGVGMVGGNEGGWIVFNGLEVEALLDGEILSAKLPFAERPPTCIQTPATLPHSERHAGGDEDGLA
jgi:hypothetical protein